MAKKTDKKINVNIRQIKASEVKNDDLKKALQLLKENKNPQNEAMMFGALQKANLLVPAVFQGNSPKNLQVKFVMVNTNDGRSFFPAFTDEEEALKLKMNVEDNKRQYVVRTLRDYALMLRDGRSNAEGIVLNPISANIVIPKAAVIKLCEAQQLKQKQEAAMAQGIIPAGVNVSYSEPRIYPTALVNAVHDACRDIPEVSRVWLKQMMAGSAVSFSLIVDTESNDPALFDRIREIAVPYAKDVPVVTEKYTEELEKKAVQDSFPLFDKEFDV